jgi:uncharacterized protein (TIGR03437 family)
MPYRQAPAPQPRWALAIAARAVLALWLPLCCAAAGAVTISPSHPELLQQGILAAYKAGQSSVTIPAGTYQIPPLGNGFHLDLENMSNFEIDARGATFVFQDQTAGGIYFWNCDGIWFHGATLYYATPPFSQGVVRAVAADDSYVDVQIEKGYPTNLDDSKYYLPQLIGHLFDGQTRWWKPNVVGDIYGTKTQRLATDTFRIFTGDTGGAAVDDLLGIRSGVGDHILRVDGSSRMRLANLTIYNSPGGAVQEDICGALGQNQYTSIIVKRGPQPPGATTNPLFTTIGGPGSTSCRTGPDIENWYMESMPDDGIAIGGQDSWVMEASGNTLIVSNTWVGNAVNFQVGDRLDLLDPHDESVGEAVVTGVVALTSYTATCKSQRTTVTDFTVGPYYKITLDRAVTAGCDYLASNPGASGAGYVLRNNTIMNHRERGMILQADNGIVEDNLIDGSTLSALYIGPESYWGSAGYSHNLTIRNNTIRNVGYWAGSTAALVVASNSQYGLTPAGNFQNILIDGNTFEDFNVTAMFISSVSGVTVSNNTFVNLQQTSPYAIDNRGENVLPGTVIYVAKSDQVQFQGNTSSQLGAFNTAFIEAAPSASVQGATYVSAVAGSDADFSGTQGASRWNYGYFPSGNVNGFTLLPTFDAADQRWQHTTFGPPWTMLAAGSSFHPNGSNDGTEEWAVRRWTSTVAGAARISGHVAKIDTNAASTGVYCRIYQNHKPIYEHFLAGTDGTGTDYSVTAALSVDDTLDFAVAPNGIDSDDSTFFSSFAIVTVSSAAAGSGPSIAAISNTASGQGGIAPATYISIYGSNFVPAGFVDTWSKSVTGGKLPTKLDGVSVSVGGQAAYVEAVTATQINVLTPSLATGGTAVTVTAPTGVSTAFYTSADAVQPALFEWPGNQAVATHLDYSYAVKNGTFAVATAPSKPGEIVVLWATGFGATTPAAPDGQVTPSGSYSVSGVSVTLAGQPVTVLGTALSPGLAGVYQIAIQVPTGLANGDYQLIAAVGGAQTPPGVLLTVGN